jgi:hypothetical protein
MMTDVMSASVPVAIAAPDDAGAVMLDPVTDELDETNWLNNCWPRPEPTA